jgi:lipoprotein-anchoring transpeptidase ErfK/SrfK
MPRSALTGSKIKLDTEPSKGKAKKVIRVNLALQIVEAYEGTERIFRFECVSGDKYGQTDRGTFKIDRQHRKYRSKSYDVQMDYAMFFTPDGKAFHQYHGSAPFALMRSTKMYLTDLVGSRGCVRLREADAKALFEWTPRFTVVHIS